MKKLIALAFGSLLLSTVSAQAGTPLAKFIEGFSDVHVRVEGGSKTCGITDGNRYKATVINQLDRIGVPFKDEAITEAYLFIWGEAFGIAKQQCAVFTAIRFGADMEMSAMKVDAKLAGDKMLIDKVKVVHGTVPGNFYTVGNQSVQFVPSTADYIDEAIGKMIAKFAEDRK